MQEWLNWPAWKASKRQKRFRGSNPLLSATLSLQQTDFQSVVFYCNRFVNKFPPNTIKNSATHCCSDSEKVGILMVEGLAPRLFAHRKPTALPRHWWRADELRDIRIPLPAASGGKRRSGAVYLHSSQSPTTPILRQSLFASPTIGPIIVICQ